MGQGPVQIVEIPPSPNPSMGQLIELLNDRIRSINANYATLVQAPAAADIDFGTNRGINCADPRNDLDVVNLRTLRKGGSTTVQTVQVSAGGLGGQITATVLLEGFAMFTVESLVVSGAGSGISEVDFVALSVDETDLLFYAQATIPAQNAPTTINTPFVAPGSRYGRAFAVNDYLVANDPGAQCTYEVMQITNINTKGGTWTLKRGCFGSTIKSHDSACILWRLIPRVFTMATRPGTPFIQQNNGIPPFQEWAWANKCIVALAVVVRGGGGSGTPSIYLLAPPPSGISNPAPGLRTMNGAEYALSITGTLTVGSTADHRITVAGWHSIRDVVGKLRTVGTGAQVKVSVYYISPDRSTAALVDNLVFAPGSPFSYITPPDGRYMPYHTNWAPPALFSEGYGYPPNVLPVVNGALDSNGNLLPVNATGGGTYIPMSQDGEYDCVVTQIGSIAAGANLDVYVRS